MAIFHFSLLPGKNRQLVLGLRLRLGLRLVLASSPISSCALHAMRLAVDKLGLRVRIGFGVLVLLGLGNSLLSGGGCSLSLSLSLSLFLYSFLSGLVSCVLLCIAYNDIGCSLVLLGLG